MFRLTIAACVAISGTAFGQSLDSEVRLEGSGKHREECNRMQLKAFDSSVWGHLTKWSGTPVTAESTRGKVLLIATWTSYAKSSNGPAIALAQQLNQEYADKGLVVVAIHNPKGFDSAKGAADDAGVTFAYAADELGKARVALRADQDPDFFLVDRAGNMRFCDIETATVGRAVEIALAETPEAAAAVPANTLKTAAEVERDARKARVVRGVVKPGAPLTVPYSPPPDESYSNANWPEVVRKTGFSEYDTMADKVHKDKPQMALNDEGWAAVKPVVTGRVQLIYTFDPLDGQTGEVADKMSRVQTAHARDLVVAAVFTKAGEDNSRSEEEKKRDEERRVAVAKKFAVDTSLNHGMNTVPIQFDNQDLQNTAIFTDSRRHFSIVFLVGTDGRCRWVGNQWWQGFETTVKSFIEADPGVKARRRAEDAQAKASGN